MIIINVSLGNYIPGPGSVSEYQVSANPWVTASNVSGIREFSFPLLTQFFTVKNLGSADLKVGFTSLGIISSSNYFSLATSESFSGEYRLKSVFVSGSGQLINLIAGLTSIPSNKMLAITGSDGWKGVG